MNEETIDGIVAEMRSYPTGLRLEECQEFCDRIEAALDRAVLAKPPRNCNRFHDWDSAEAEYQKLVEEGKVEDGTWCEWLFAPATEGGAR